MLLAQIEGLHMAPLLQVPEVQLVAVLTVEEQLGLHPALDHLWRAPLAADQRVVAEMPPEVVVQVLRAAVDLPPAEDVEGVVIEHEDAAGTAAVGGPESADVDAIRSAVDRVPIGVAGLRRDLFGLDRLDDAGPQGVGFGIDDVDARGAESGHDQVAALDM